MVSGQRMQSMTELERYKLLMFVMFWEVMFSSQYRLLCSSEVLSLCKLVQKWSFFLSLTSVQFGFAAHTHSFSLDFVRVSHCPPFFHPPRHTLSICPFRESGLPLFAISLLGFSYHWTVLSSIYKPLNFFFLLILTHANRHRKMPVCVWERK